MNKLVKLFTVGLIVFLFPIIGFAVQEIYCPALLTCVNRVCTPLPDTFYVNWISSSTKNTYYFDGASGNDNVSCEYRIDPHPQTPVVGISSKIVKPDFYISPQKWNYNSAGALLCSAKDPKY